MHTPITSADVFCIMLKCRYITQSYVLHFTFHFHQYPNLFYFYNYNLQLLLILLYTNMYKFQTVVLWLFFCVIYLFVYLSMFYLLNLIERLSDLVVVRRAKNVGNVRDFPF